MNRNIKEIFIQNNIKKRKTNIGYIVAGYPTVEFTKDLLINLNKTSIDILEIGIPYSDPLADGKLISDASFKTSQKGVNTDTVFNLLYDLK
ncbi:MAG: tryptophan synthase subunit alpha, partial [Leptotrichiaceae bacterium]|nr:tryptophan synthase subunit alpha [Leptotrichiaceae bacterium]